MKKLTFIFLLFFGTNSFANEQQAKRLFFNGIKLYNAGQYQKALQVWQQSLLVAKKGVTYFNMAQAFFKLNNLPQERQHYIQAIQLGLKLPLKLISYERVILASIQLKDEAIARKYIREAFIQFKNDRATLAPLQKMLQKIALTVIEKRNCPLGAFLLLLITQTGLEVKGLSQLNSDCEKRMAEQLYEKGRLEITQGQAAQGISSLKRALEYRPEKIKYLLTLVEAYRFLNNRSLQIQYLQRILKLDPANRAAQSRYDQLTKTTSLTLQLDPKLSVQVQAKPVPFQKSGQKIWLAPGNYTVSLTDPGSKQKRVESVLLKEGDHRKVSWKKPVNYFRIVAWTSLGAGLFTALLGGVLYWTAPVQQTEDPNRQIINEQKNFGPSLICFYVASGLIATAVVFFFLKPKQESLFSGRSKSMGLNPATKSIQFTF